SYFGSCPSSRVANGRRTKHPRLRRTRSSTQAGALYGEPRGYGTSDVEPHVHGHVRYPVSSTSRPPRRIATALNHVSSAEQAELCSWRDPRREGPAERRSVKCARWRRRSQTTSDARRRSRQGSSRTSNVSSTA